MPPRTIDFSGRRVSEILDQVEPRLRRAFLLMVERIRSRLPQEALADLLANGDERRAFEAYDQAAAAFAREASNVYLLSGDEAAAFVGSALDLVAGFDQFGERAVTYIREKELSLIREFTNEQREVVRNVIEDGVARGLNPIAQAREFRESIGLTARQESAVSKYRDLLERGSRDALSRELRDRRFDGTLQRSIRDGVPLTTSQVDAMVDRYRERYVKYRAETIARNEALQAVHAGLDEAVAQLVDRADVQPDEVTREWNTAGDERVRPAHQAMHGQVVGLDEPFIDGDGNEIMFPGDPSAPIETTIQCRCAVGVRIKAQKSSTVAVEA